MLKIVNPSESFFFLLTVSEIAIWLRTEQRLLARYISLP